MPSAFRAPLRPVVAPAKAGARTRRLIFCRRAAKRSRSQDWRAAVRTTRRSSRAAAARGTRARKRSPRAASRTPAGSRQGRCLWPAAQLAGGAAGPSARLAHRVPVAHGTPRTCDEEALWRPCNDRCACAAHVSLVARRAIQNTMSEQEDPAARSPYCMRLICRHPEGDGNQCRPQLRRSSSPSRRMHNIDFHSNAFNLKNSNLFRNYKHIKRATTHRYIAKSCKHEMS